MWFLKLLISLVAILLGFIIYFCYFWCVQKVFNLKDSDVAYTIPIGICIILFFYLVYVIYINLPF